jgi:predicted ATPase/DNA-binding CsgD family transcriptional regulator
VSFQPANLPLQLTRFIGRDAEIVSVLNKLADERLVTLTGPGGVGKTRLALEVAASAVDQEHYPDGVWLIELAALSDPLLVPQAVATPLGVRAAAQARLEQSLVNFVRPRRMLLVLDNCEHLVDTCAKLAEMLLRACAGLHILATSREPLKIAGEWTWRVAPLPVPTTPEPISAEQLLDFASARLFVDRASAAAGFKLTDQLAPAVARVCQRLDGIPLALELAAARVAVVGVAELRARLDDALRLLVDGSRTAPARHQTLQAAIDWSYGLLSEPERLLLDRLSVFAGGFGADSVQAIVAGDDLAKADVLDLLGGLVEKSLVVAEPLKDGATRYRLQEVVRQYGCARLRERGELEALKSRHAAFFVHMVQQAEPGVLRGPRERWQDRLELDMDNFRAARTWLVQHADTESALRLNAYLFLLLAYRGYANEGRASLREALGMCGGSIATRGRALHCLALLAYLQADYRAAAVYGEESLALRRKVGDPGELAWSLLERGSTACAQAQFDVAEQLLEEARDAGGTGYVLAYATALLGHVAALRGNFRVARQQASEALQLAQAAAYVAPTSHAQSTLGELSAAEGDLEAARVAFEAAVDLVRSPNEVYLVGRPLLALALVAVDQGDFEQARGLLMESLGLVRRLGNPHRVAQNLEGVAVYAARRGQSGNASRFVGAALALRTAIEAPPAPTEQRLLDQRLRAAGPTRDADAGRQWSVDQACALAVELLEVAPPPDSQFAYGVRARLSAREAQVAALVARGLSNREIARTLTIAERTATSHVEHVLDKLGFHSRAQIATWVTEQRGSRA